MKIDTINIPELGGICEIKLNKKHGFFFVDFPNFPYKSIEVTSLAKPQSNTFEGVKEELQLYKRNVSQQAIPLGKVISVFFRSSSENIPAVDQPKSMRDLGKRSPERITDKCAIELDYAVFNKSTVRHYLRKGKKQTGYQGMHSVYEDIYEWKEVFMYFYVRGTKYNSLGHGNKNGSLEPELWRWSDGIVQTFDYSEEIEEFLKETISAMESVADKVTDFFRQDQPKLLSDINSKLKLLK